MWEFSILFFLTASFLAISVILCRHIWVRIPIAIVFVLIPTLTWYLYSPVHRGPPSIMKSIDRASINNHDVRNWADTVHCTPPHILKPTSTQLVATAVNNAKHIRVVGGGHSWSPLICSNDTVISLENICNEPLWHNDSTVTFDAGCFIQDVQQILLGKNKQLHGYGAIQHQTLAGGFMTALHGAQFNNFASNVVELDAILANGTDIHIKEDIDTWRGSMGLLGIVHKMRIRVYPSKSILVTERSVTLEEAVEAMYNDTLEAMDVKTIWGSTKDVYHLRVFSNPIEEPINLKHDMYMEAFFHDNVFMPALLVGSRILRHLPIAKLYYPEFYQHRESIMDAWYTYPEFGFKNAAYSISLPKCLETIRKIRQIAKPYLVTVEFRKLIFAPGLLTWVTEPSCVVDVSFVDAQISHFDHKMQAFHTEIENIIEQVGGSAHWGKFYASNYSKLNIHGLDKFRNIRLEYDPSGKFLNPLTSEIILGKKMSTRYPPSAIESRAEIWRFTLYISFTSIIFLSCWPTSNKRQKRVFRKETPMTTVFKKEVSRFKNFQ